MPAPILAEFDWRHWGNVLAFFGAIVTIGWGTLTFLKLWNERKIAIKDRFIGRWEWTLDSQVLEIVFKPDDTWEGRVLANRGILGAVFGLFSSGRIAGTWFIATSAGRTVTIREASGKWHVEDRIRKIKKNKIQLAAKGDLIRIPAAADLESEKEKQAEAATAAAVPPPPPPSDSKPA